MTTSIRRPEPGDRVRKIANIHGTTIAWFTVTRVAFKAEGDYLTALTEIPQFCSLKFPTPGRFRT